MEKVILLALLLVGCSTAPTPSPAPLPPVAPLNEKKEAYIAHIENEAAEAAAALGAISGKNGEPSDRVIGITINRLQSIQKPSQEQIRKWAASIGDVKKLDKEDEKTKKLEQELNEAWTAVAVADAQIESLSKAEAYEDIRDACIWLGSILTLAGVALAVAGMWVGRGMKEGGLVLACGVGIIAAPLVIQDIVEAQWFKWTIAVTFIISLGFGVWRLFHVEKKVRHYCQSGDSVALGGQPCPDKQSGTSGSEPDPSVKEV
jgi:hypothetical protein